MKRCRRNPLPAGPRSTEAQKPRLPAGQASHRGGGLFPGLLLCTQHRDGGKPSGELSRGRDGQGPRRPRRRTLSPDTCPPHTEHKAKSSQITDLSATCESAALPGCV